MSGTKQLAGGVHLEDVLVEVLLQALVGEVDAQLLERVGGKALEAVDVQDADYTLVLSIPTYNKCTSSSSQTLGSLSACKAPPAEQQHAGKMLVNAGRGLDEIGQRQCTVGGDLAVDGGH